MNFYIYHLYDKYDLLLYIGVTSNLDRRLGQHRCLKKWYWEVDHILVIVTNNISYAYDRENELIISLKPKYNVSYKGRPRKWIND